MGTTHREQPQPRPGLRRRAEQGELRRGVGNASRLAERRLARHLLSSGCWPMRSQHGARHRDALSHRGPCGAAAAWPRARVGPVNGTARGKRVLARCRPNGDYCSAVGRRPRCRLVSRCRWLSAAFGQAKRSRGVWWRNRTLKASMQHLLRWRLKMWRRARHRRHSPATGESTVVIRLPSDADQANEPWRAARRCGCANRQHRRIAHGDDDGFGAHAASRPRAASGSRTPSGANFAPQGFAARSTGA